MRVFAVSGYSGSGKTTIVERIVKVLTEQGHSVIAVKSSAHDVKEDKSTDSGRHRQAGARNTIILGPKSTTVHYGERRSLASLLQGSDAEYLIIEGMKGSSIPKFWCVGPSGLEEDQLPHAVKAIVVWKKRDKIQNDKVPIVEADDMETLLAILDQEAIDFAEVSL